MRITEFTVENYKSLRNVGPIKLDAGVTVVAGQNNSGKSALLECLRPGFPSKPHRSIVTVPHAHARPDPQSLLRMTVRFSKEEVRRAAEAAQLVVLLKHSDTRLPADSLAGIDRWLASEGWVDLELLCTGGGSATAVTYALGAWDSVAPGVNQWVGGTYRRGEPLKPQDENMLNGGNALAVKLVQQVTGAIYHFFADRRVQHTWQADSDPFLASDGRNLPGVIDLLRGNAPAFARFNGLVQTVFPHIRHVNIRRSSQMNTVVVWFHDLASEREDLAVPLEQCGTGVSQALAVLYLLVTADTPRVMLLDEPQTYLHPSAVRRLVRVINDFSNHQYIIATHSPVVLTGMRSAAALVLTLDGAQCTKVAKIDPSQVQDLRAGLAEVGITLGELFGIEAILWVEGATEAACFPSIVRALCPTISPGSISFQALIATGDFDAKDSDVLIDRLLRLYAAASGSELLLPAAVGYLLDRDGRTTTRMADLQRRVKGRVGFLPQTMFEDYLLDAEAVAAVLVADLPGSGATADAVRAALARPRRPNETAAKLLESLFNELSGNTLEYRKVVHSVAITEWLADHRPEALREVATLIVAVRDGSAPAAA